MLDFILSKMNLLILVTAIFAIVSFFAFGLSDIAKVKEAGQEATKLKEVTQAIAQSSSSCLTQRYALPPELEIAGSTFYYVIKISKQQIEIGEGKTTNVLIFSVFPRDEIKKALGDVAYSPKAIAADSFRTKAQIFLYSKDYTSVDEILNYSNTAISSVAGQDYIYLDPQAVTPGDSIELVKEVEDGASKLYVIGCNSAICPAEKDSVGKLVHPQNIPAGDEGGFGC